MGVEALPGVGASSIDTASGEANRALDALRAEVTLVVATGGAVLVDATLAIAFGQRPFANTRGGLEERMGGVAG